MSSRPITLGLVGLALASCSAANAQVPLDDFGFYYSLDPVGTGDGDFRLAVNACDALEAGLAMLRHKHGWLIIDETPVVQFEGDRMEFFSNSGRYQGVCLAPRLLDVTYSTDDPLGAIQAIAEAHNGNDPHYTVRAEACGGHLCVIPTQRQSASGILEPFVPLLDTPVTMAGGSKTVRAILEAVESQLQASTTRRVSFTFLRDGEGSDGVPAFDVVVTDESFDGVPARDLIVLSMDAMTQYEFATRWQASQADALMVPLRAQVSRASDQHFLEGMRQGISEQELQLTWEAKRASLVAAFVPAATTAEVPAFEPPFGPGWTFTVSVEYASQRYPEWSRASIAFVYPRSELARLPPIPHVTPRPGSDADGDGVVAPMDQCAGTAPDLLVASDGCSVVQTCPCDAPWSNNGEYNACLHDAVGALVAAGVLPQNQKGQYQNSVKEAGCGQ